MTRVAIVGGARTPFVRAGGVFANYSFLDLSASLVKATAEKLSLGPREIEEFVFSTVLLDPRAPNFAREVVFKSGLPKETRAHSVSNNCISGLVAATFLAEAIVSGRIRSGLAGGCESMSQPALALHKKAELFFIRLSKARSLGERLMLLKEFRLRYLFPQPPSPKEPSTGLTMGQHCEITTKEFAIERAAQDLWALGSHKKASDAQRKGIFDAEIISTFGVNADNLIRGDSSLEKLAKLPPVFDRSPAGTLTAGNSSGLTDGASLVCLMAEEFARAEGREILAYLADVEFAAIDPHKGLLMAPGVALPQLLSRNRLRVEDVDLFEIHEAFAAQVIANRMVWEKGWKAYPELKPIGAIPDEKINVNGGSLAIGHPFAATGGRLMLSAARELQRRNGRRAVISVCAAGAMACAMLLVRE
ncbi:MAG: acetyl-CoA C-acyltransferase [Bdellovibrionota bacterium]|nr:MAG: acetyl-CoA C-acyltransferase [Bdellovibrionota bacterium]